MLHAACSLNGRLLHSHGLELHVLQLLRSVSSMTEVTEKKTSKESLRLRPHHKNPIVRDKTVDMLELAFMNTCADNVTSQVAHSCFEIGKLNCLAPRLSVKAWSATM